MNAVISTKLAHAVHDEYRSKTGHCLFRENVGVEATMQVSTPTEALHFCTMPSSDSCTPSRILSEENFEDGSLTGWTNGRTTLDPTFSHFLGRYGQEDMGKYPRKTYFIPMDAEEVVLEYDMYEIDSWDGHRGDSATVYLDGKRINLGTFRHRKRENGRTGFAHGVSFRLDSAPLPTTSAFAHWEDEIHHVTMRVPKSFYRSDGELKVEFRWSLNQGLIDESIGFDNIKLTAEFDCTGKSSCARSIPSSIEDFQSGVATGWTNGRTTTPVTLTRFLGRYGKRDNGKFPKKTYAVPKDADSIVLDYLFYEIDSWDDYHNDRLEVVIDGKTVSLGKFDQNKSEDGRSGTHYGINFSIKSMTPPSNIGKSHYSDQIHHVTMTIPNAFYESDGKISVQFRMVLNEDLNNESAGFDNIRLTAKYSCSGGANNCVPSKTISYEDFEYGDPIGWSNGRVEDTFVYSTFLGPYGRDDKDKYPSKTYAVSKDAKEAVYEFDFYEMNTWDNYENDSLQVKVDHKIVNLGTFDRRFSEDGRSGTHDGISFSIKSEAISTKYSNGNNGDQIHYVTLRIPKSYFQSDGKIKIEFRPLLNEGISNESAGFDNIRLTPVFECDR